MTTLADISNNLATQNGILDKSHDELTDIKTNIKSFLEEQKGIQLDELEEKIKARREAGNKARAAKGAASSGKRTDGGGFSTNMMFAGLGGLTTAGAAGLGAMAAGAMTIGKIGAIAALSEPMSEFITGFALQMLENTGVMTLDDEQQAKFQMNMSDIIQGGLIGLMFGKKGMIAGLVGGAMQKFILTKFDANNDEKITSEIAGIEINWTSPYLAPIIGVAMTTIAGALIKAVGRRMLLPAVATALGAAAYKMFGGDAEKAKADADAKKKFRAADLESRRAYEKYVVDEKAKARRAKMSLFRSADKTSMMNFAEWEAEQARIRAEKIAATSDAPKLSADPDNPKAKLKTYIGQGLLPDNYRMTKTGGFMDMSNGGKFTSYDQVVADIEASAKKVKANVDADAKAARIAKYAPMINKLGKIAGPLGAAFDLYEAKRIIQKEGPYEGISDEEQKKQLAGQISGASGAIAFGALGAAMGTPLVPPFGSLGGGVLGAVLGSLGSEYLGEALASWIMSDSNNVALPKKDAAAMALAAEAAGFTMDEFGALHPRSQAMIRHRYDLGQFEPIEIPTVPLDMHPRAVAMRNNKQDSTAYMPIVPGAMAGMNSPMNLGIQGGDTYNIQGGDSIVIDSKSAKDEEEGGWFSWLPWK